MVARRRPVETMASLPSGSTLLDLALGGVRRPGWARGRVSNLVGDESTGKSLIAIETLANVARISGADHVRYAESEHAYDVLLAHTLGMPRDVEPEEINTVEEFFDDLNEFLDKQKPEIPSIYVMDSLDALADEDELDEDIRKGSFGTAKAKLMSKTFRTLNDKVGNSGCHLMIVSQTRDKIGITFGEKKTRAGGKALNFYSSQTVWLSEVQKLVHEAHGIKRVTGVRILARNKKNKISVPFRQVEFNIRFMYGIDDETSMIVWLKENKAPWDSGSSLDQVKRQLDKAREDGDRPAVEQIRDLLKQATIEHWERVERYFAPPMQKYG